MCLQLEKTRPKVYHSDHRMPLFNHFINNLLNDHLTCTCSSSRLVYYICTISLKLVNYRNFQSEYCSMLYIMFYICSTCSTCRTYIYELAEGRAVGWCAVGVRPRCRSDTHLCTATPIWSTLYDENVELKATGVMAGGGGGRAAATESARSPTTAIDTVPSPDGLWHALQLCQRTRIT